MKLLIVEDDKALREMLSALCSKENFEVILAANLAEACYWTQELSFDALLLDVGLPDGSGLNVLPSWRKTQPQAPVLMLTARGHWTDKVAGLEAGADDYLTKPFEPAELLARLRALIRRAQQRTDHCFRFGNYCLDTRAKTLTRDNAEIVALTRFEYVLLETLLQHPGKTFSKSELIDRLYEPDAERDPNVIEVFVGRLRKKIDLSTQGSWIETVRGLGYRLRCL
ncbi:MAG: response regulator transcription factor [Pseudomonadota bacterium]